MNENQFHVLNGDALKEQFPPTITGDIIVIRECLVDGPVTGNNVDDLLANRAKYLNKTYRVSFDEYQKKTIKEFEKFKKIKKDSTVNLWFEDDLFCQVHLWFTAHILYECYHAPDVHLIRPTSSIQYGFGGMNSLSLKSAFLDRKKISTETLIKLGKMWLAYQRGSFSNLITLAEELEDGFSFLMEVVTAHIERFPNNISLGRPEETLQGIIRELETTEFVPVFQEFTKRESIYGFGDIQVKRMLAELLARK